MVPTSPQHTEVTSCEHEGLAGQQLPLHQRDQRTGIELVGYAEV